MSPLRRLRAWLFGQRDVAWSHWVPAPNSREEWDVGRSRCFYCLAYEDEAAFAKPCPRRRPNQVELA